MKSNWWNLGYQLGVLKRLAEIPKNDIDELFSRRLFCKERLWGRLDNHILKIQWWGERITRFGLQKKKR
ncbi:MAG: hypothetical protein DRR19_33180 [Candidatus Parabeggiatoa sp. nov. 1]|nr:MAG: hypothetical protein DRR19_33180 [Gammaproteobacteria bacterium]